MSSLNAPTMGGDNKGDIPMFDERNVAAFEVAKIIKYASVVVLK